MKADRISTQHGPRHFQPIDFTDRFPALNGIRALAVTMVFLGHYAGGAHGGRFLNILNEIRLRGWIGVDLFFVLSGFLITGILFDTRQDSRFFRRFFGRRSLRIFPVFYLVVVIALALTPFLHYQWRAGHLLFILYMGNLLTNIDFSYADVLSPSHPAARLFIGHLWSLCVEEQFYLLWPIVVWWMRDRIKLLWTAAGLSLLALLLRCLLVTTLGPHPAAKWIYCNLPFRIDSLLIGGMLALLLRGPSADKWQRLCRPLLAISGSLLLAFTFLSPKDDSVWLLTIGYTLIAMASAGLIGSALRTGSPAFKLFHLRPLHTLGKYSYGFYIFHLLYFWAWFHFFDFLSVRLQSKAIAGMIMICTNFLVTFLVAKLSYDLFEVKFLKLKRYFEYDAELVVEKQDFSAS